MSFKPEDVVSAKFYFHVNKCDDGTVEGILTAKLFGEGKKLFSLTDNSYMEFGDELSGAFEKRYTRYLAELNLSRNNTVNGMGSYHSLIILNKDITDSNLKTILKAVLENTDSYKHLANNFTFKRK